MQGGKLFLFPLKRLTENPVTKDRIKRENQTEVYSPVYPGKMSNSKRQLRMQAYVATTKHNKSVEK